MDTNFQPNIEVVSWEPVAYWKFKTIEKECQICKQIFEGPCLTCNTEHCKGDMVCNTSRGKCGHSFHKHCIDAWIVKSNICPTCATPYAFAVNNMNNNEEWKKISKNTSK